MSTQGGGRLVARRPPALDMVDVYGRYLMHHRATGHPKWTSRHYHPSVQQHYRGQPRRVPLATVKSDESFSSNEQIGAPFDEEPGIDEDTSSEDEEGDIGPAGCTDLMCLLGQAQAKLVPGVRDVPLGYYEGQQTLPAPTSGVSCKTDEIMPSPSEMNEAMASVRCTESVHARAFDTQDRPFVPNDNHYDFDYPMYPEDQVGYNYPYQYNYAQAYQVQPSYNCAPGAPGTTGPAGHPCAPGHPSHPGYNYAPNYPPGYNYPPGVPDAVLFSEYAHLAVSPMSYHESLFTAESAGSLSDDEYKPEITEQKIAPPKTPVNVPFDEPLVSQISFVQERPSMTDVVLESFEMQPYEGPTKCDSIDTTQDRYLQKIQENEISPSADDEPDAGHNKHDDGGGDGYESEDESVGLASYTPSVEGVVEEMAAKTRGVFNPDQNHFDSLLHGTSLAEDDDPSFDQGPTSRRDVALADIATIVTADEECFVDHDDRSQMEPGLIRTTARRGFNRQCRNLVDNCRTLDDIELERSQSEPDMQQEVQGPSQQESPEPVAASKPTPAASAMASQNDESASSDSDVSQRENSPPEPVTGAEQATGEIRSKATMESSRTTTETKQDSPRAVEVSMAPTPIKPTYNVVASRPCLDDIEIRSMQTHPSFDEHPTPNGGVDELMGGMYGSRATPTMEDPSILPNIHDNSRYSYRAHSPFSIAQSSSRKSLQTAVTRSSTRSISESLDELAISDSCSIDKPFSAGIRRMYHKTSAAQTPRANLPSRPSTIPGTRTPLSPRAGANQPSGDDDSCSIINKPMSGGCLTKEASSTDLPQPSKSSLVTALPSSLSRRGGVDERLLRPRSIGSSSSGRRTAVVPKTMPIPPPLRKLELAIREGNGGADLMGDVKRAMAMRAQNYSAYENAHFGDGKARAAWELTRRALLITAVLNWWSRVPQSSKSTLKSKQRCTTKLPSSHLPF